MWQRRMFSTTDTSLDVRYTANGQWMGAEIGSPNSVTFDIDVQDPDTAVTGDRVTKVEIIGEGGVLLDSQSFSSHSATWSPSVAAGDNSYMLVRVFTDERSQPTALAAPVWLD